MKVYCLLSLESPRRGHSNKYTKYTIFNIDKKITLNFPKSAVIDFFQGTQDRVRNRQGKQAIRVQAIEVLLFPTEVSFSVASNCTESTVLF